MSRGPHPDLAFITPSTLFCNLYNVHSHKTWLMVLLDHLNVVCTSVLLPCLTASCRPG
jgi:hypothetical protein